MDIPRRDLAVQFEGFEHQGGGVLIGAPGIGKTHLLAHQFRAAIAQSRPAYLLALDKHSATSDSDLRTELQIDCDLVELLDADQRATATRPGLLLIDSYDALRSEEAQKYVRTLIRRAQNVLQPRWRIVVAVRTFDATRSETLLQLFPSDHATPEAAFQMPGVNCRHFLVPLLSENETAQAVATVPDLARIYEQGSRAFRLLLRSPFNLWLTEKLLSAPIAPPALSTVSSEVQLLSLFWRQRVATGRMSLRRRSVLTRIARAMVEVRRLSLRQDSLYRRQDDDVWQDLLSSEVLTELGSAGQRVAFAHNILFDFAVGLLLIEDEPAQVADFLAGDFGRPIFLRPSINYYFTRLWFEARDAFWAVAWFLLASDQVQLRLFGRLIPMTVVVREARSVGDLAPVLRSVELDERAGPDAVLRLLQARRALKAGDDEMWLAAFERLAAKLHPRFAWDITVQTFEAAAADVPREALASAGRIGRTVLTSVWALRRDEAWADALAASWATRLVARSHCTDPERSRTLLRTILEAIDDRALSVEYVRHIARNVDAIWGCDPSFVAEIYERVFAHRETNNETTPMGTPVVPMTSNRRQDFRMCVYQLGTHYTDFLAANEEHAIRGGIAAVDRFVEHEHVDSYIDHQRSLDELVEEFTFGVRRARYMADGSEYWRGGSHQDEELKIADDIFGYMERSAQDGDERAIDLALGLLVEGARMAFWWAGLLVLGTRHGELFAQRLYPLCVAGPVLLGNPTLKQVVDFIGAAYPFWSVDQRRGVERAVVELARRDGGGRGGSAWSERILGVAPVDLVVTEEARAIRAQMAVAGRQPTNEPLVRMSISSGAFEETDWLREQGADLEEPANQRLREASVPLVAFEQSWRNGSPTSSAVGEILLVVRECTRLLGDDDVDEAVAEMVRTRIATTAMVAARVVTPGDGSFEPVRGILLEAARESPAGGEEPSGEHADFPHWSPRPETEAAQGLPWIAFRQPDEEVLAIVEALARNWDAIIRYLVVRELFRISSVAPGVFWRLIDERIANDRSSVVRLAVCESLARIAGAEHGRVADAARRLWSVLSDDGARRTEFRDILLDIVIWLRFERRDVWAGDALGELARSPMSRPSVVRAVVFRLWHRAIPTRFVRDRGVVEDVLDVIADAVHHTCRVLGERDRARDEEDREELRDLYAVIDDSVAHVYFCFSRQHSRDPDATEEARRQFFFRVEPILNQILDFGLDRGFVLAPTVHHFMELLNEVVQFDAARAVVMAARAARAGESADYNIDALAVREVVQLVERVLADHRGEVQEAAALQALMDLLDVFAATGWPEAIQLVWRLDELFR